MSVIARDVLTWRGFYVCLSVCW